MIDGNVTEQFPDQTVGLFSCECAGQIDESGLFDRHTAPISSQIVLNDINQILNGQFVVQLVNIDA